MQFSFSSMETVPYKRFYIFMNSLPMIREICTVVFVNFNIEIKISELSVVHTVHKSKSTYALCR